MTIICESVSNFKSTLELAKTFPDANKNRINDSASNCDRHRDRKQCQNNSNNNNDSNEESNSAKVLRIVWHALYDKYEHLRRRTQILRNFVSRENNKPLAKKIRRSIRLNKSAKKKGYEFFLSDEEKR